MSACELCPDGFPTKVYRIGRANYECAGCGRDVSMILMMMEAGDFEVLPAEANDEP